MNDDFTVGRLYALDGCHFNRLAAIGRRLSDLRTLTFLEQSNIALELRLLLFQASGLQPSQAATSEVA